MQEVRWGAVVDVAPLSVRFAGDTEDALVTVKNVAFTPAEGDKVLLVKAGSTDGWVLVCKLEGV